MYRQLTEEQRINIWALRKEGKSQSEIATQLNVHRSTISRELARNSGPYGYEPHMAQQLAEYRKQFHSQIVERQYEELIEQLKLIGWNSSQCERFMIQFYPELDISDIHLLFEEHV
ncbi:helix-turn-helix domain-containing protein [Vibrio astriarenae]|uniref:helix-turn-helix domain-containing protein n=1 Tax=Vibrio astriarenae TaxID=1481923 RepID=UPI003735D70E